MRNFETAGWTWLIVVGCVLLLGACGRPPSKGAAVGHGSPEVSVAEAPSEPTPVVNEAQFHAALRAAAADYEGFGEVDDLMRWVPGLCRIPVMEIHPSRSADANTHGGKLFWMFAKERDAYLACAKQDQPVGQVLVKEAWASREATAAEAERARGGTLSLRRSEEPRFQTPAYRTLERDGTHFTADHKKALYVILKLAPETEGTDGGWVYGTLTPDGQTVTSAGRVASCMRCHVKAARDRMFGLKAP